MRPLRHMGELGGLDVGLLALAPSRTRQLRRAVRRADFGQTSIPLRLDDLTRAWAIPRVLAERLVHLAELAALVRRYARRLVRGGRAGEGSRGRWCRGRGRHDELLEE
eukprot:2244007-Heterocapsa_arctica.AAC.1